MPSSSLVDSCDGSLGQSLPTYTLLKDAPLDRILTQDGSELRNLAGRTIRIADGLSRSAISKELGEERQLQLRSLLEARTEEMCRLQALLKDDTNDFFHIEPDMIGKVAAEDYGLTAVENPAVKIPLVKPRVKGAFLAPLSHP